MKLTVLVCLCSLVVPLLAFPTSPLRGDVPVQCGDPTFACQDLESARRCDTVKDCIHDIWANIHIPEDNDQICDICKEMVKEARDQLLSNMTQEEIKEVFEGSCKLIPVKIIAEGCIKIVDEIIPELVEMLASRMDPNMVCTVSGMCFPTNTNSNIQTQAWRILRMVFMKEKDAKCDECVTMLTDVQTFMKSESEADTKALVLKLCDQKLPSYLCSLIGNHYFHEIYQYVLSSTPLQMCSASGVCPQSCQIQKGHSTVKDDLTCEFCEHLIEHVKDLITTNTTMDEFKTALLNFCKATGKFSDKCTAVVNEYYDTLFSYIKNLDSKGMCTLMGLCTSGKCSIPAPLVSVSGPKIIKKVPLIPLKKVNSKAQSQLSGVHVYPERTMSKKMFRESNDIFQPMERVIPVFPGNEESLECSLCKAFSFYLEQDLNNKDKNKQEVRKAISNVCDKWMPDYPDHCSNIVRKYSFKMLLAIEKQTPFEDLCSRVRACPLKQDDSKELKVKVLPKIGESVFCDLCKDAMSEVEKQLSDPATKEKLENLLGQACNVLPQALKDVCVNFINQNVDAVLDILQQELMPDNICPALKLCGTPRLGVSSRVKDLECDVCKDVVSAFKQKLQDPASKEIVEIFLEEGCARLPSSVSAECKKFVDENIDTLMKIIIEQMDPQKVCSILSICPNTVVPEVKVKDVECDLCKEVVGKVEDLIKDKKTEDEIKAALDKVCSYLPSSIAGKCQSFVNTYTELLITLIEQEADPQIVCDALNLCTESKKIEASPVKVSKLSNAECDFCKEIVGKVEDMLKDQKTEDEIKQALDRGCSYLPTSAAAKCQSFVNQYISLLITLVTEEVDPQMICSALKLCPESEKKIEMSPAEFAKLQDVECDLCKEVVGKVEDMLKDQKTEDEIKQALDKGCSLLPASVAAKCQSFVNQYINLVITLITEEVDPQIICSALGVCPESEKKIEMSPAQFAKLQDVECDLCKEVVGKVEDMLKDQKTEDEIKQALDKGCSLLPASVAAKCQSFVNQYINLVITLVTEEVDPQMICSALGVCPESEKKIEMSPAQFAKLQDVECDLCKEVVDKVEDMLKDQKTEDEIKQALDKGCSYLPTSAAAKCQSFVNQYISLLITLVTDEFDPRMICSALKVCTESRKKIEVTPVEAAKFKDIECDLCKQVIGKLEDIIKDEKTEDKIKDALDKVCSYLPASIATRCENFVNQYSTLLITLLTEELDPDMICAALKLCPAHDLECKGCEFALKFLQDKLMNGQTQASLKELLKRVCVYLPKKFSQNCDAYVDEYGTALLVLIADKLKSSQLCYKVDMCSNQTKMNEELSLGLDECSVCTTVVDYLDKLLEEDDVDKEITSLIERVCSALPSDSLKQQCSTVLEAYGPYILQMIGQLADSKQICQDIDLCARSPEHVHLVGGSKCTFGPSYWCRSVAHAHACKVESFCQEKVWKN